MAQRIYVKPARPGLLCRRDDNRQIIPPEGAWMQRTTYVIRRMRDGDLVECSDPAEAPAKKTNQKAGGAAPAED